MAATIYAVGVDLAARRPICSTPAIAPEFAGVRTRVRAVREAIPLIERGEPFRIMTDSDGFDRLLRVLDEVAE